MKRIILLLALLAFCTGCPPTVEKEPPKFQEGQTVYFRYAATRVVVNEDGKGEAVKYFKEAVVTGNHFHGYVNVVYWDDEGERHEELVEEHELMSKEEAE
ncbi:MAG: hypothetical protein ACXADB_12295 [Candidatus Hermodarchaeia archaeon]|jgi:hypothetical protein